MKRAKKKKINMYTWMNRNKKTIVSIICFLIAASMLFGVVAQFIVPNAY